MNDPEERLFLSRPFESKVIEELIGLRREDEIESWRETFRDRDIGRSGAVESWPGYFIACGTKSSDELIMWRDYGKNQAAYAIGFDRSIDFRQKFAEVSNSEERKGSFSWREVKYWNKRDDLPTDIKEYIEAVFKNMAILPDGIDESRPGWEFDALVLFYDKISSVYKHSAYEVERELRLTVAESDPTGWDFRSSPKGLVPFVRLESAGEGAGDLVAHAEVNPQLPVRQVMLSPGATRDDMLAASALLRASGYSARLGSCNSKDGDMGGDGSFRRMHPNAEVLISRSDARMR